MTRKISYERAGEMMKAVLIELKNADGQAKVKDLFEKAADKLHLTEYEQAPYEKTGYIRWQSIVHFDSINCVKAGYIQKSGGTWILTPQGEEALKKPAGEFIEFRNPTALRWGVRSQGRRGRQAPARSVGSKPHRPLPSEHSERVYSRCHRRISRLAQRSSILR